MSQLSDLTDLQTDTHFMNPSTTTPVKSGINANQKKVLGITAATLLLGGAAWAVSRKITEKQNTSVGDNPDEPVTTETEGQLPADVDVAGKVTDSMSFEQAFGAARDEVGMGGVFSWHGHWYNTFEKEEWSGLSLTQRQEYTEMVTGEKLPVKPYGQPVSHSTEHAGQPVAETEPTIIEGYLNGQRVMGLDFDQDGVIDTLVMDGPDGQTYRVVDTAGDDGLDTVYRYDSLDGTLTGAVLLDQPFVLSNDDFSQHLENTMSREVVDSILEPDASTGTPPTDDDVVDAPDEDDNIYLADAHEPDDTYVNNADVHDMDE